jgi:GTP-binding protein
MDARHPMKPLDVEMLNWYRPTNKPVHILLTKSDKLSNGEQVETLRAVKQLLIAGQYNATVQLFSSLKKSGVREAETAIGRLFEKQASIDDFQDGDIASGK